MICSACGSFVVPRPKWSVTSFGPIFLVSIPPLCHGIVSLWWTSVGEVWFGSVWGTFCQTGNQTIRFFSDFQKLKPKPHQTVWCGFKWFQTWFKPKPFLKKIICNNLFTLHNFVVYLLQIYLIYIKLHIDGCPEEKR